MPIDSDTSSLNARLVAYAHRPDSRPIGQMLVLYTHLIEVLVHVSPTVRRSSSSSCPVMSSTVLTRLCYRCHFSSRSDLADDNYQYRDLLNVRLDFVRAVDRRSKA
jgi:hypothetical protein